MAYRGTITERNPAGAWGQAFGGFANQLGQGYAQNQQLNLQNQDLQNLSSYYMDLQARQQPGFTGPPMPMPELKSLAYSQMAGRNMLNNLYIDPYKQSLMERNRALTEQQNSPVVLTKALVSVANSIAGLMDAGEEPDSPLLKDLRTQYNSLQRQLGLVPKSTTKPAQIKTSTGAEYEPVLPDGVKLTPEGAAAKDAMSSGISQENIDLELLEAARFARENGIPQEYVPFLAKQRARQKGYSF